MDNLTSEAADPGDDNVTSADVGDDSGMDLVRHLDGLDIFRVTWTVVFTCAHLVLVSAAVFDLVRNGSRKVLGGRGRLLSMFSLFLAFELFDLCVHLDFYLVGSLDEHVWNKVDEDGSMSAAQTMAFAVEYTRLAQRTLIMSLGLLELLQLLSVSYTLGPVLEGLFSPNPSSSSSSSWPSWATFLGLGLGSPLLPLAARAAAGHNTLLNHEEMILVPGVLSLALFAFVHLNATRLRHHFCHEETARTKVVLALLAASAAESAMAFVVAETAPAVEKSASTDPETGEVDDFYFGYPGKLVHVMRDSFQEVANLLYPAVYHVIVGECCCPAWSARRSSSFSRTEAVPFSVRMFPSLNNTAMVRISLDDDRMERIGGAGTAAAGTTSASASTSMATAAEEMNLALVANMEGDDDEDEDLVRSGGRRNHPL